MMIDLSQAEGHVQCVGSFHELMATPFQGKVNALCWARALKGDFSEIVGKITPQGNVTEVGEVALRALQLSEQGALAREILINDLQRLEAHGAAPVLNLIRSYDRDEDFPFFPTDVYSYHVDRSPVPTDTILCTYYGAASEILPNAQVMQKVLVPEIREKLRQLYGGPEEGFDEFLSEYFFDLHYAAKPHARPVNVGVGHLWRLAIDHPESQVLPCVHRAPVERDGEYRLLLIC